LAGDAEEHDALSEKDSEMTERISLEGKVAVVTGAGRGLGRAYVELLAERGARVVVNDLGTDVSGFGKDSTIAEQVVDLIRSRGGEAIANDSDISSPEGGSDLIATTIEHFGRVDLLVNNVSNRTQVRPPFAAKKDPFDGAETGGAEPHIAEQSRSWRAASGEREVMRGS
jgi:NAD(P)-dependent dehydrogenase (short-subunit alcohol dehydrogenase family)